MPYHADDAQYRFGIGQGMAGTATLTMMFAARVDNNSNDDSGDEGDDASCVPRACGRNCQIFVKLAVSANNKTRRKVRISAWNAPAIEDLKDRTNVGLLIDENNEAEVVLGTPTPFHLPEINVPPCANHPEGRMLVPGITFFVEWLASNPSLLVFVPTFDMPTAYLQIVERCSDRFCAHRLETLAKHKLQPETPVVPSPPADRPVPKPEPAAKRARKE